MLVHVPDNAAVIFDVVRTAAIAHAKRGEMLHATEAFRLAGEIARSARKVALVPGTLSDALAWLGALDKLQDEAGKWGLELDLAV